MHELGDWLQAKQTNKRAFNAWFRHSAIRPHTGVPDHAFEAHYGMGHADTKRWIDRLLTQKTIVWVQEVKRFDVMWRAATSGNEGRTIQGLDNKQRNYWSWNTFRLWASFCRKQWVSMQVICIEGGDNLQVCCIQASHLHSTRNVRIWGRPAVPKTKR